MRQETRSALTSVIVFGLQAAIAVLMTPFLVSRLGVYEYSVIPLINSFTPYLALAASSIGTAAGRELTLARRSMGEKAAVEVFSTGVVLAAGIAVAVFALALTLSPVVLDLLRVPLTLQPAGQLLMIAAGASAGLAVLRSPLLAVPFSENRLDLDNVVVFSDVAVRAIVTVALFVVVSPNVEWVAWGVVAGAVTALAAAVVVWRRLLPSLRPSLAGVRKHWISALTHVGSWFVVGQVGALLFWSTDLFVLSIMTNAATVGLYGTVAVWPVFLRGLAGAGTSFLNPLMVRTFGSGDKAGVLASSMAAVRLVGIAVALPVGLVAGFASPLLSVWLGADFVRMAPVLIALVLPLGLNLSVLPLFGVNVSYGRLAWPGIMTLVAGAINIVLSVLWAKTFPLGLGVALGTAIALTTKNALFTPWYAARIQNAPLRSYAFAMVPGVVATLVVFGGCFALAQFAWTATLLGLLTCGLAVAGVFAVVVWSIVLTKAERSLLVRAMSVTQS